MNFFDNEDSLLERKLIEEDGIDELDIPHIILEKEFPELYRDAIIRETKKRPLFYTIFTDSGRIKDIALKYQENFIVLNQVIINIAQFWQYLYGVIVKLFETESDKVSLSQIKDFVREDIPLVYSDLPNFSAEISDQSYFDSLESICLIYSAGDHKLVLVNNTTLYNIRKILDDNNVYLKIIKKKEISLEKACKRIFLRNHKSQYSLESLLWELDRVQENIIGLTKPTSENTHKIISALQSIQDFSYSIKDRSVVLQNLKFKEVYDRLSDIKLAVVKEQSVEYSAESYTGLVSLIFVGNEFIVKNAIEYVKIRPLVYIRYTSDINKLKQELLQPDESQWAEIHSIIYAFLYNDPSKELSKYEIVSEWIKSNLTISTYVCSEEEGNKLVEEIMWAYPPVLNYSDNPDNIVKVTIETQLRIIHGK